MARRILSFWVAVSSGTFAAELSPHRALQQELRDGRMDSATALRLEELLAFPVAHPLEIPADLLERIPGVDPDCRERALRLPRPLAGRQVFEDGVGDLCAEALEDYLEFGDAPAHGAVQVRSVSLMEEDPQWKRDLRASQKAGPARLDAGWAPDRTSPWTVRRAETVLDGSRLRFGDLEGWREAPDLWSRPRKALPSRSFLDGSGSWMNGGQISMRAGALETRVAVHERLGEHSMASGIGAFRQFLSIAGGRGVAGRWLGAGGRLGLASDGAELLLLPTTAHNGDTWNRSLRMEAHGHGEIFAWSSWAAFREENFPSPMASLPSWTGRLGRDSLGTWKAGGFGLDGGDTWRWHGSLTAASQEGGNAVLLPVADLSHRREDVRLETSARGFWLVHPEGEARRGWASRQGVSWTLGALTPAVSQELALDTLGWRWEVSPSLRWSPCRDWEASASLRQFLTDLKRRELAFAATLRPVRGTSLVSEVVRREGAWADGQERWYFRLEGRSRW